MKRSFLTLTAAIIVAGGISSCNKSTTNTNNTNNGNSAPSVNTPANADGALAAIKVITTQTVAGYTVPINIGTAAAWFGLSTSFKDAGNVTVDGNALTNQSNSYVYQPNQTNPTGLDFNSSVSWNVTGNSSNGITGFSYTDQSSFPTIDDVQTPTSVSHSSSFTLSASGYVSGDSVIFVVSGGSGHVSFIAPGGTSSHTFTAAEMGTVGAAPNNTGLLQIAPYRVNHQTINGKSYYFVKETCANKFVTIN
ncbi:MAG: hypothetical protein JSS76_01015 [Bacteroidetes bacterium]|nr:hypothetical protein [Bacteroidota bacterium]